MLEQEVKKALQEGHPAPAAGFEERNDAQLLRLTSEEKAGRRLPRAALVLCTVLLVLGIATALAATNESFNARLYELWPEAARALMPVNLTCDDQGIRLEIISAVNQDSDLLVTYSLEDLEGDRINQMVLSYLYLETELSQYSESSQALMGEYDAETRKMIYAQHEQYDSVLNEDGKIIARLKDLWPKESVTVDLRPYAGRLNDPVQTMPVPLSVSVLGPYWEGPLPDALRILDSNSSAEIPLYESVYLSGIGMIDGRLHVQLHFSDCHPIEYSPECFFAPYSALISLRDGQGESLYAGDLTEKALSVLSWGGDADYGAPEWMEFFFAVDPESVENAEFTLLITKNLAPIQGDWEISIPLRIIRNK